MDHDLVLPPIMLCDALRSMPQSTCVLCVMAGVFCGEPYLGINHCRHLCLHPTGSLRRSGLQGADPHLGINVCQKQIVNTLETLPKSATLQYCTFLIGPHHRNAHSCRGLWVYQIKQWSLCNTRLCSCTSRVRREQTQDHGLVPQRKHVWYKTRIQ